MNSKKTANALLNASLILHGIYAILFMLGYVIQKPIWYIFVAASETEGMNPIISPAILIAVVGTLALSIWLNFTLHKKVDGAVSAILGVLTTLFCIFAFLADRLTKAVSCVYYSAVVGRLNGVNAVFLAGLHENSVQFIDTFLLIFLVAGLALLPCAYCIIRYGEKENNYSKG